MKKTLLLFLLSFLVELIFSMSFAQTVDFLTPCFDNKCFEKNTSVAISHDGSFFLVADQASPAYLRKVLYDGSKVTEEKIITLSTDLINPEIKIAISNNDLKGYAFAKDTKSSTTSIITLDLKNNSTKTLNSLKGFKISAVDFLDEAGQELIIGTDESTQSKLYIVDIETDQIRKEIYTLLDSPEEINMTPDFKKALISYKGYYAQSLSLFDLEKEKIYEYHTPSTIFFDIDDFVLKRKYNTLGDKAVISSFGGKHVLNIFDLKENRLIVKILSNSEGGSSFSDISCDGKTTITGANIDGTVPKFKIYKTNISDLTSPEIINEKTIEDGSTLADLNISRDGHFIYSLVLKDTNTFLKIFDIADLSLLKEFPVSNQQNKTSISMEPLGRYILIPSSSDFSNPSKNTITIINNLEVSPTVIDIKPKTGELEGGTLFVVNSYIDPLRFDIESTMVCFGNNTNCATSVDVSSDGKLITGYTPGALTESDAKVILSVEPLADCKDCTNTSSKCTTTFRYLRGGCREIEGNVCETIAFNPDVNDINSSLINTIQNSSCEGASGIINLPELDGGKEGLTLVSSQNSDRLLELPLSIPRGCSKAVVISPKKNQHLFNNDEFNDIFSVILTDSIGQNFLAGVAYYREYINEDKEPVPQFITTVRIPATAKEGDGAKISILDQNKVLLMSPVEIPPMKNIKTGKSKKAQEILIANPKLKGPTKISAKLINKNIPEAGIILRIKGMSAGDKEHDLLKRFAIINGEEQKLKGKNNYLTKVSFIPPDGIVQKKMRFTKGRKEFLVKSLMETKKINDPALRLVNIETPQCSTILGFIAPESISEKKKRLITALRPEGLIIEHFWRNKITNQKTNPNGNNLENRYYFKNNIFIFEGVARD